MNLLVTGGAGYIGSIVAECAAQAGHDVVVIDDLRAGNRAAVPASCRFIHGSVGDEAALDEALDPGATGGIDAVLHLAAEAAIETSVTDPALFFQANLSDSLTLFDAMRRHGVSRLIFSSTAATYGEPRHIPIDEEHEQRPVNAYGDSKLMVESCLRWYERAYGLRSITFRYFNAAGATEERGEFRRHETHLLPLILDAVAGRRERISVFGTDYPTADGTCIRDYVHVEDIARAHLLALDHVDDLRFACFNIGSETGFSVRQVIEAVERTLQRPVPWTAAPRRPGDPTALVASARRVQEVLGWRPLHGGLETIIESAWQWRTAHPQGYATTTGSASGG